MNKRSEQYKANMKSALKHSFFATLVAALLVVAAFFLPLASANEEHKKYLEEYAQEINIKEISLTNESVIHISMYEFAKTYWKISSVIDKNLAVFLTAALSTIGIMSLFTLLFTLLKRPIAIFIFNLMTFGVYYLMTWDFKDRGVMPNIHYEWGISYYLYFIGFVLVFAGSIWMFIKKIKVKRQMKKESLEASENEK